MPPLLFITIPIHTFPPPTHAQVASNMPSAQSYCNEIFFGATCTLQDTRRANAGAGLCIHLLKQANNMGNFEADPLTLHLEIHVHFLVH